MAEKVEYSKRLGAISVEQFQQALDRFNLGRFISAEAIPFGLFGQNVFVTGTTGEYVLRGTAHYDWQFPKEQFIANILHEQTGVPVPYPYLHDTDDSIFGWKWGYVLMPRMPGLQLADAAVLKTLSFEDRTAISYAVGENLWTIQQAQSPVAGQYDLETKSIMPFEGGFAAWLVSEIRTLMQLSVSYNTGATEADQAWIEGIIRQSDAALHMPYAPVLVMHDYKEGNLTVQKRGDRWTVSGVFDLMEAIFGDGELDLVRQLAIYLEEPDPVWAKAFLDGYQARTALRPEAKERLAVYMVYDRLIIWTYFHRPENVSQWWYEENMLEAWLNRYLTKLDALL